MWKWLHPYAKAERAYQLCNTLLPYFAVVTVISMVVGWIWGLGFAPADYQQKRQLPYYFYSRALRYFIYGRLFINGDCSHCCACMAITHAELAVIAIAPVGACMTAIALITGAAWGKPMWGAWWVWDARLTSELILLFYI